MRCTVLKTLLLSLLQLFPQLEETMIWTLKESLEHYEQLKLMEDMLKEDNTVGVASMAGLNLTLLLRKRQCLNPRPPEAQLDAIYYTLWATKITQ